MDELEQVTQRIVDLLSSLLPLEQFDSTTDLIEQGGIDSAGFMELFCQLENEFDIFIGIDDLQLDNFRTVKNMAAFVMQKKTCLSDQRDATSSQ